jgi:hypothetical protein
MQLCLDRADQFLGLQTPNDYIRQLAAASEALRRAKVTAHRIGGALGTELEQFRRIFNGEDGDG